MQWNLSKVYRKLGIKSRAELPGRAKSSHPAGFARPPSSRSFGGMYPPVTQFETRELRLPAPVRREPLRVVVGEDSVLLRAGIVRLLQDAGFDVVGQAGDRDDVLRKVRAHRPDVAVIDVRMPPEHTDEGLQAAQTIRAELPQVGVLVLSAHLEERYARELLDDGAEGVGYLLKDRVAEVERFTAARRARRARRLGARPRGRRRR